MIRDYGNDRIEDDRQVFAYKHMGSTALRDRVAVIKPALHVFGHYHCGYGSYRYNDLSNNTIFVNAAVCDEDYYPEQKSQVVDVILPGLVNSYRDITCDLGEFDVDDINTAIALMVVIDQNTELLREDRISTGGGGEPGEGNLRGLARKYLREVALQSSKVDRSAKKGRLEKLIYEKLMQYRILHHVQPALKISRGANVDSSEEFRQFQMVLPHLYIGPVYPTTSVETLKNAGITHICNFSHNPPQFPNEFKYLQFEHLLNKEYEIIQDHFLETIAFIEEATCVKPDSSTRGKVLVYCELGISRSPSVVIAYLMFALRIKYRPAFYLLKRARPYICPSDKYIAQLESFEASVATLRNDE